MGTFRSLLVNSTAVAIKAAGGTIVAYNIINRSGTDIFVKIYNKAAATVNPASDVPVRTLQVPASGSVVMTHARIVQCNTALSVRAVTGSSDNDTTAPSTLPIIEIDFE